MYHVRESDRRWWVLPTVSLVIAICASLLVWLYDLDLIVATWMQSWNTSHGGRLQDRWWGQVGFYLPMIMSVALGLGGVAALLIGLLRPAHQALIRPALFVVLCLAIGPGLIANAMLKDHWGRPRPRETIELGGSWAYLGPWVKGPAGRGKSFPCGHATVPALGVALWLLWRRNRPALARGCLIGGVVLTLYVGGLRMLAGGHWLSDVLWAAALMVVVSATLHRLIALVPERAQALPGSERVRWLVVGGVAVAGMAILAGVLLATPFYRELKAGLSPAQLGGGRWRLEVEADVGDVVIDLRSAALAASPALEVVGETQGFGFPGSTVDRDVSVAHGVARVRLRATGWFTERTATLRVRADPAELDGIVVHLGAGDVALHAEAGMPALPTELHLGKGEAHLPEGWSLLTRSVARLP